MKIRTIVCCVVLFSSTILFISDICHNTSAQTVLIDDLPVIDGPPVPEDYEFDVLNDDHAVIGVSSIDVDDFDIEVFEDTSFTTLIELSQYLDQFSCRKSKSSSKVFNF